MGSSKYRDKNCKHRKRKSSKDGKAVTLNEIVRQVKLVQLKFNALNHKLKTSVLILLFIIFAINGLLLIKYFNHGEAWLLSISHRVNVDINIEDIDNENTEKPKIENIIINYDDANYLKTNLKGLGEPLEKEIVSIKKESLNPINIPISDFTIRDFENILGKIEKTANKGWNVSSPKVLPLGQLGYVKRDLPVYKDGFNKIDIAVGYRPKSGIASVDQLSGNSYNMIICLSFNTDHCFEPTRYDALGGSRKVNRIQNLRDTLWSKNKFCRTISSATKGLTDQDLLSFTFPCWVMPGDYDRMLKYSNENDVQTWISKPRSLGAGMGIYVISDKKKLSHEKSTSNVVQTYLEDPHLIEKQGLDRNIGRFKWDMRSYVLVSSVTPLRAYIYHRGLIRISTSPYTKDCSKNVTACLTNTSLNKKVEGANLKDITWSFEKMKKYLEAKGELPWDQVMERIQRAIGLTLISGESTLLEHFTPKGYTCENCYQLLGVDVIFDSALEPKVVEINGEPNLKLTGNGKTHYDFTKRNMARDLIALVYNNKSVRNDVATKTMKWAKALLSDEKNRNNLKKKDIFIGEDHIRYIMGTIREHTKLGGFLPIYPNPKLSVVYGKYLRFLRDKEASRTSEKLNVHGNGRRYRLHQIITILESPKALEELSSLFSVDDEIAKRTTPNLKKDYNKKRKSTPDTDPDDEF